MSIQAELSEREQRVDDVIASYFELIEAGADISIEEWIQRHPQHAEDIREFFGDRQQVERRAAPLRAITFATADIAFPGRLGDFRLTREIGRGGMGVVYEAEQISLRRRVAVKVLPFAGMLDERQIRRFQNEARAAAGLHHANIVPVFGVGCERGVHFYVMQLIEGRTLADRSLGLRPEPCGTTNQDPDPHGTEYQATHENPLAPPSSTTPIAGIATQPTFPDREHYRSIAHLGIQAAEALDYAHREGVIHRDIKPSNLLVDSSGKLWIADFGLARVQTDPQLTGSGDLVGTLRYMSPEQARGERTIDPRSDVYSLGATLYELLTSRPAFAETERAKLLDQVIHHEPLPPHKHNGSIPPDLETIVLKAMSKTPADRYSSAQAMADDLKRFIALQPIQGRRATALLRTWRWCQRSPAFASLAMFAIALFFLVSMVTMIFFLRERDHRQTAVAQAEEAEWQQYLSDMRSAMAAWEQSNVGLTLELLERHRPAPGEADLRGFEWDYLWRRCHDKRLKLTINETSIVRGVTFSHDGSMLATGNDESLVRIWDVTNGWLIHEFKGHPNIVSRVAFSPDDRIVASGDVDGMIHLRELADSQTMRELAGHTGYIYGLLFSSDGKQLASGGADETVRIWDVATGRELKVIRPQLHKHTPTMIIPPWTDNRLWVFAWDGALQLFDTDTGIEQRLIDRKELSKVRSIARVSWDGRLAATSGRDGVIRLFETETGRDVGTLGAHGAAVFAMAFAPGDQTLASSDAQGKVVLWDLAKRTARTVLRGHSGPVWPIDFSNDGQRLCTCCGDRKLRIWDVTQQPSAADVCEGHDAGLLCVAFSPDGRMIASGGQETSGGLVMLWDTATGRLEHKLQGHTAWVWSVAFSPDGKELTSTGDDGTLRQWDLTRHRLLRTIDSANKGKCWVSWVSYSRDGRELISSEKGGTLRVWDRGTGTEIRATQIGQSQPWQPALSPDGRYLVAGVDESIVLLEYPSLKTLRRFPRSPVFGRKIAISPDGRIIASCDSSNHIYLSSLDGTHLGTLEHAGSVNSVGFSPDGRTLVTGDMNHEVHIWDVERRQECATLRGHDHWVEMVRFSPDGKTIASTSDDGTVRLWRSARPD